MSWCAKNQDGAPDMKEGIPPAPATAGAVGGGGDDDDDDLPSSS